MKAESRSAEWALREQTPGYRGTNLDKLPAGCLETWIYGQQRHGSLLVATYLWLQSPITVWNMVKKYSGNLKLATSAERIPRWAYVINYILKPLNLKKLYCPPANRLLCRFCFFSNLVSNEYTFDLITHKPIGLPMDKIFTVNNNNVPSLSVHVLWKKCTVCWGCMETEVFKVSYRMCMAQSSTLRTCVFLRGRILTLLVGIVRSLWKTIAWSHQTRGNNATYTWIKCKGKQKTCWELTRLKIDIFQCWRVLYLHCCGWCCTS